MAKPTGKMPKSPSVGMNIAQASRDETAGLLKTIDKGLEDIRAVITCRVCVRPLYEPFTVECGHTFCYSCLVSWFERNSARKSCPDCRATITRKPAPAYLVRDITQLFSNRAELLPAGETTREHQDQQREEGRYLEADKKGRGLFRGCFRHEERFIGPPGNRIIIDDEDGVSRCPRCAWEMEDDMCVGCGWSGLVDSWADSASEDTFTAAFAVESDGAEYDSESPTSMLSEDEDDEGDDSAGSLNGFVVSDEQVREPLRGNRPEPFQWSSDSNLRDALRARPNPPVSSIGIATSGNESDSQEFDHTSEGNSDAASLDASSRSVSPDSVGNFTSPSTVRNHGTGPSWSNSIWLEDSDGDNVIPPCPPSRRTRRPQATRVSSTSSRGNRSMSRDVAQISSEAIQSGTRSRTHENRNASHPTGDSNYNTNNGVHDLTSDEEELPRTIPWRTMQRNISSGQFPRRRAARPTFSDEDDEDEPISVARSSDQDLDETLRGHHQSGVSRHQRQALSRAPTSNGRTRNQSSDDSALQSRFDPVTSMPVRRENVNMPGAFPPSFISEQGHSQSTPPVNAGAFPSPILPDRSSAIRPTGAPQEDPPAFLDRRRREERTTQATHMQQTRRRDRSAAKAARRQDRERVKAEHDARGRRAAEPSAPPVMAS